jgi:hypothetical protein
MKLSGTVEKIDLGSGVFVLKADNGQSYQLRGGDRALRQAGKRVEVDGDVDGGAVSAGMAGPVLNVKGFKAL